MTYIRGRDIVSSIIIAIAPLLVLVLLSIIASGFTNGQSVTLGGSTITYLVAAVSVTLFLYLMTGKQIGLSDKGISLIGPYEGPAKNPEGFSRYPVFSPKTKEISWSDVKSISITARTRQMGKNSYNANFVVFHLNDDTYYSIGLNVFGIRSFKEAITELHKEKYVMISL